MIYRKVKQVSIKWTDGKPGWRKRNVFAYAGVRAYYGPTVLTPIVQPGKLDAYTEEAIQRTLFSNEVIGEIRPSEKNTPIDWNTTYTIKEGLEEVQYWKLYSRSLRGK